jgi:hypothetical protein
VGCAGQGACQIREKDVVGSQGGAVRGAFDLLRDEGKSRTQKKLMRWSTTRLMCRRRSGSGNRRRSKDTNENGQGAIDRLKRVEKNAVRDVGGEDGMQYGDV